MKSFILFSFLIAASLTYSQDLTDTIYYKSGQVRVGRIYQESKSAIKYEYFNDNDKIKKAFTRKIFLNGYTVGDKQNSIASNYTSPNPVSKEQREEKKEKGKHEAQRVGVGVTGVVIAGGLVIIIGILVLLRLIS